MRFFVIREYRGLKERPRSVSAAPTGDEVHLLGAAVLIFAGLLSTLAYTFFHACWPSSTALLFWRNKGLRLLIDEALDYDPGSIPAQTSPITWIPRYRGLSWAEGWSVSDRFRGSCDHVQSCIAHLAVRPSRKWYIGYSVTGSVGLLISVFL